MHNITEGLYKDLPLIISTPFAMTEPNQPISIHKGNFKLRIEENVVKINGEVKFKWLPYPAVRFSGIFQSSLELRDLIRAAKENKKEILINNSTLGEVSITNWSFPSEVKPTPIKGEIISQAILGDKVIPVSKIKFAIPNLRSFCGEPVKVDEDGFSGSSSRLTFENDKYVIIIDKMMNYDDLHDSLSSEGGYVLLYAGELAKRNGSIHFKELENIFFCFSTFLSFLNGRRCAPLFCQGIHEDKVMWTEFSRDRVDIYKSVRTWTRKLSIEGFNEIWKKFSLLWQNENDQDFLISAVHWYVEANANSGYVEGAIIMAQAALELIYNWLLIEKRRLLIGNDKENISASNKIRLVLSQLNQSCEIPKAFNTLQSYADSDNMIDGPDAFVQIRNAVVHAQEEKRNKLRKIPEKARYEALKIGIWYIELSLLFILGFHGKYNNRCSGAGETYVPWVKK